MNRLGPWRNSLVAFLVAVPAGVAGGVAVDVHNRGEHAEARAAYDSWEPAPAPPVPEQLDGLLEDLAEERVFVAHDVADLVAPDQVAAAREALESATVPSYLVLVREPLSGDHGYREGGVLRLMEEAVGGPSYLVLLTDRGRVQTRSVGLDTKTIDPAVGKGRPGKALVAVAQQQVMEPPGEQAEIPQQETNDYFGGRVGAVLAGALISGAVIAPAAWGVDLLWRRRRPRGSTPKMKRGRVLP